MLVHTSEVGWLDECCFYKLSIFLCVFILKRLIYQVNVVSVNCQCVCVSLYSSGRVIVCVWIWFLKVVHVSVLVHAQRWSDQLNDVFINCSAVYFSWLPTRWVDQMNVVFKNCQFLCVSWLFKTLGDHMNVSINCQFLCVSSYFRGGMTRWMLFL